MQILHLTGEDTDARRVTRPVATCPLGHGTCGDSGLLDSTEAVSLFADSQKKRVHAGERGPLGMIRISDLLGAMFVGARPDLEARHSCQRKTGKHMGPTGHSMPSGH